MTETQIVLTIVLTTFAILNAINIGLIFANARQ